MAGMKTSNSSWTKLLVQMMEQAAKTKKNNQSSNLPPRIAIIGVGSELNGDDAAGLWVARNLQASHLPEHYFVFDGGSIPENASGPLRRFQPDLVILVDAADMSLEAGTIQWLDQDKMDGMSASSHTLPLSVFGKFLSKEINCQVEYLGIQPARLDFATELTKPVNKAVTKIAKEIEKVANGSKY